MDPLSIAALTAAAGSAASNLGTIVGGARLQRENKRRLEELKKAEEMGALGLTAEEEAAIGGRLRSAQKSAQEQTESLQKRLLAGGGGATGGQALASETAAQQARMAAESGVAQQLLEQDLARKAAQEEEMRALEAAVAERRREAISAAGAIVGSGIEAGLTTSAQQAVIQGQKDISPEQVAAAAEAFGTTPEKARGLIELSYKQPELAKYYLMVRGGNQ